MAMGEEVGDAYISVHANTKAARAEIAALGKDSHQDFLGMDDDINRVNNSLDKTTKKTSGRDRLDQLRLKMREVGDESKRLGNTMKDTFKDKDVLVGKLRQGFNRLNTQGLQPLLKDWREMGRVKEDGIKIDKKVMSSHERLAQSTRNLRKETRRTNKEFSLMHRVMTRITSPVRKLRTNFTNSFRRMDSTVRLVIGLIAIAGNLIAALGSGASAAGVAIASAGALALAGCHRSLACSCPSATASSCSRSPSRTRTATSRSRRSPSSHPRRPRRLDTLARSSRKSTPARCSVSGTTPSPSSPTRSPNSLEFDTAAAGIGKAFSAVTDSLTAVLKSPVVEEVHVGDGGPTHRRR